MFNKFIIIVVVDPLHRNGNPSFKFHFPPGLSKSRIQPVVSSLRKSFPAHYSSLCSSPQFPHAPEPRNSTQSPSPHIRIPRPRIFGSSAHPLHHSPLPRTPPAADTYLFPKVRVDLGGTVVCTWVHRIPTKVVRANRRDARMEKAMGNVFSTGWCKEEGRGNWQCCQLGGVGEWELKGKAGKTCFQVSKTFRLRSLFLDSRFLILFLFHSFFALS